MLKKLRVAVCEADERYRNRLADYLLRQEREHFEVFDFSKEEIYLKEDAQEAFDILLFGEGFFQKTKAYQNKEHGIYLSEGTIPAEQEGRKTFFKYQSADNLLRELHLDIGIFGNEQKEKQVFFKKKELITIYSSWNHRMQTPFALAAAEELAKMGRKKVLYLNFSVCSGFCKSAGIEKGMDMGDLFYLLREGEEEFLAKMGSSIYPVGNFFVIPPPENPKHYLEWKAKETERFLELLLENTKYEAFLLDISCLIPGFLEILEKSSRIWLLREYRNRADLGLEEVHALLGKGKAGLEERVEEVFLPGNHFGREDGRYQLEEFYMGEAGRCARRLLEGDGIGYRTNPGEYPRRNGFERGER